MAYLDDTPTHDPPPPRPPASGRPAYRVPIGMPFRDDGRRAGAVVSILIHAILVALLIIPFMLPSSVIERIQQGAGGAGPAGGGGGGNRGTGGQTRETLRFVRLAPEPVATPKTLPAVPPPVTPKVEPPKPKPAETPPVKAPEEQAAAPAQPTTVAAAVPGANGGSGNDGTAGAGPGSGGGVGSGVGTGKGSATGPGTGGGNQANYPPTVVDMNLPPMPAPKGVRGMTVIAEFDVDSTGRVLDFKFTETPDGGYNRQIATALRSTKFRPGTRPDGSPLRMKAQISIGF